MAEFTTPHKAAEDLRMMANFIEKRVKPGTLVKVVVDVKLRAEKS